MTLLQGQGGFNMLPLLLILGGFIIFSSWSSKKKDKKEKEKIDAIKAGQDIILKSGIFGKVISMDERYAWIKIDQGVKIKIVKEAILGPVDERKAATAKEEPKQKPSLLGALFGKKEAAKSEDDIKPAEEKIEEIKAEKETIEEVKPVDASPAGETAADEENKD
ncbi:MAG: preprotein translocase subunit YajC [Fusobacteriaceae bacterium]|jgi:preprotein translocase subunit YajC|nr:preprotein translocase subunit YajC [Fusobacteriaceae bacterium]